MLNKFTKAVATMGLTATAAFSQAAEAAHLTIAGEKRTIKVPYECRIDAPNGQPTPSMYKRLDTAIHLANGTQPTSIQSVDKAALRRYYVGHINNQGQGKQLVILHRDCS